MSDALVNGLAGAGGGIIAQTLTYPLQAVSTNKTRSFIKKIQFKFSSVSQYLVLFKI